ncbi:hypothetical protein BCR41DRAFT_201815 [Lobosporangium transversale]|uniref:Uncharacterized protein n=1 Tax=Lobosporangium transversale TaxID=64571 RepID=A0A1Y2GYL7_9FUNG|nr:hypothetical protein BCR41DRAFT_201815 [Lobosporangium transversale]ORZ26573.1 hypothetical protein BCR41DRAFT_201815 [Lobosporangium transversale]|eukprot:XP_021884336.1 hypothetical protein BCR41DRAFT_201815 [Lobosporangium transversale]
MKLEIELEQAKLQDQLTRHVQVLNLVKRNKRREAKEEERAERRRLRKERRARATDEDQAMTDVGPQGSSDLNEEVQRRSERHRRHRSPRHTSGDATANGVDANGLDIEEEDEEARQRRKQERRERRERKERRAQRRRDREQERLPLPMVVVRMPGYAGQSSDSESNISVVRRVREEQKPKRGYVIWHAFFFFYKFPLDDLKLKHSFFFLSISIYSSKSKRRCESTGQEITMVEIQIPQQDELSIISDTEILGDLGFNTVTMDELETMLPKNLIDAVKYTVNSEERHNRSPRGHRRMRASEDMLLSAAAASDTTDGDSTMTATDGDADMMSGPTCITVRGGFEREIVRAASEGVSASS